MSAYKVFEGLENHVPEGTSHEYACTCAEANGTSIALGAISGILCWLDDVETNTTINSRASQNVLGANGGTLTNQAGVGLFTLALSATDAVLVGSGPTELHRLTLKFTYTRTGGGTGTITRRVFYRVANIERI